jgi:putative RNA 2'-phosphotransferase
LAFRNRIVLKGVKIMGYCANHKESISKFISFILRHKPEAVGISLDDHGWADVDELIAGIQKSGKVIDMTMLEDIVRTDEKGRYSFNEDKTKIRANQGHSIAVDVELKELTPPDILYHGTAARFLDSIKREGIKSMDRQYVHLSVDYGTAVKVGKRHGYPVVLKLDTTQMAADGIKFYLSENGVWLTKYVDWKYVTDYECCW